MASKISLTDFCSSAVICLTASNLSSSCGFSSSLFQLSTNRNHIENKASYNKKAMNSR
ncbi:hypothetical protein J3U23_12055 [Gilliamella sp. B3367]|nr:hypothetical protein [Gilliamella sp. B3367]MCX8595715.1 hypothetical protein [Gilliamella sp. B3367]